MTGIACDLPTGTRRINKEDQTLLVQKVKNTWFQCNAEPRFYVKPEVLVLEQPIHRTTFHGSVKGTGGETPKNPRETYHKDEQKTSPIGSANQAAKDY